MNVSFAPLKPDAVNFLTASTGVYYSDNFDAPRWFCVTARNDEGGVMGVVACEFRTFFEASFNAAVANRHCLSKRLYRAIFKALFSKAVRVTAEVGVDNRAALRIVPRLGFVYEGYCRLGINGVQDAYVFGMLKEDCKFLPGYVGGTTRIMEMPDGQRFVTH